LFGAVVLAVAIAFGLAFGLGGQEAARRWLARGESTLSDATSQISTQQSNYQLGDGQQQQTADQMRQWQQTR